MARPTNVEKKSSSVSKDKKESAKFPGAAAKSADAGAPAAGKKRKSKPSRRRPGTRPKWERNAMRAIKRAAKSTTPNIPRAAYKRSTFFSPPPPLLFSLPSPPIFFPSPLLFSPLLIHNSGGTLNYCTFIP